MGRPIGSALEMRMVATTPPSPASPPTGTVLLYFKSDGLLYQKTNAGIETVVSGGLPSGGATTQYLRGDKSWQTLDKTAAGLPNVDNTSDVNKPVSTATSNALAGKEPTIAPAVGTPSLQYWRGDKSWQTLNLAALPDAWVKRSVRVASTANVVIATGGLQTVDGITLAAGDRVLLKDQTTPAENGIYQVNAGAWTRATDGSTSAMMSGADVAVDSGTQGGWLYSNLFKTTDTLGTTAMYWYRVVDTSMLATVKVTTTGFITLSGTQVIDGVSVVTGDRVLVRMQGTLGGGNQYDNGIYVVQTGAWTRATDADAPNKLAGQSVYVQQGGQHGGVTFKCSMLPTDTLGVTSVQYSSLRVESVGYLGYPAPQGNGHTIYDFNRQMLASYDVGASAWRYSGVAQVAATAPANLVSGPSPVLGWQWYDTTAKVLKVWDGAVWQPTGGADTGWVTYTAGTGTVMFNGSTGVTISRYRILNGWCTVALTRTVITAQTNSGPDYVNSSATATGAIPAAACPTGDTIVQAGRIADVPVVCTLTPTGIIQVNGGVAFNYTAGQAFNVQFVFPIG